VHRGQLVGREIPDGISISVTSVHIRPRGVFAFASFPCDGERCRSSFVFRHKDDSCYVAVHAKQPNTDATMTIRGTVRCPTGQRHRCEAFVADLANSNGGSIGLWWQPDTSGPSSKPPDVSPSPSTD
jgi:hypothetical protein